MIRGFITFIFYECITFSLFALEKSDTTSTLPDIKLQEVVVTGRAPVREVIPVQTLKGEGLQRLNSNSVADALRYFSGVQVKDYGGVGGIKTVNIRSMGTNHTGVVYDGVALGNAQNGQIDLGQFSLDNIEAISLHNGQKSQILQPASDFVSAGTIYMRTRAPQFAEGETYHARGAVRFGAVDLEPGQTLQLTAYTDSEYLSRAADASNSNVRWVSTNPNVAFVDQSGLVIGVGAGKCSIAAFNSDNVMANCLININSESESVITLDTDKLDLKVNETHQFKANVAAASLSWSSSNPEVAEIDANGYLTAKSKGTSLITATDEFGNSASCLVNVHDGSIGVVDATNDDVVILVKGSNIMIEGLAADVPVDVYALDGKLVYSGLDRRITLQMHSVYIVVCPGTVRKIAI